MTTENTGSTNATAILQDTNAQDAFEYLKSLPRNEVRRKVSDVIDEYVAQGFTDSFRNSNSIFTIPVSWSMTKDALLALLGITENGDYDAITGIRFYAGLNTNAQLTLIAVSTEADSNDATVNNDLTVDDNYPYYDYADPCPNHCSNVGNLRMINNDPKNTNFIRVNNNS